LELPEINEQNKSAVEYKKLPKRKKWNDHKPW
jgi:hypothetical protein